MKKSTLVSLQLAIVYNLLSITLLEASSTEPSINTSTSSEIEVQQEPFRAHVKCCLVSGGFMYVGASQAGMNGSSVCRYNTLNRQGHPLVAPKYITFESPKEEVDNPLFNVAIEHLGLFHLQQELPIVVTREQPYAVYGLDKEIKQHEVQVLAGVTHVRDAGNQEDVIGVTAGITSLTTTRESREGFVFLAVKPSKGDFGDPGTGIALVRVAEGTMKRPITDKDGQEKEIDEAVRTMAQIGIYTRICTDKELADAQKALLFESKVYKEVVKSDGSVTYMDFAKDPVEHIFNQEELKNAQKGVFINEKFYRPVIEDKRLYGAYETRAARFDKSSPWLCLGNNLAILREHVPMTYNTRLRRLYVAVQAQAGSAAEDGVCAIAVGRIEGGMLLFEPFVPDLFIPNAGNEIIGARGADTAVSFHQLETLFTSTKLSYLVALGGNGQPEATKRTVWAFPLVNSAESDMKECDRGTLAVHNTPIEQFTKPVVRSRKPQFLGRFYTKKATRPEDIITSDTQSSPLCVGGGPLMYGDIASIYVKKDVVFACVTIADEGKQPGVFSSQALFDKEGSIKGWTTWSRVGGITNPTYAVDVSTVASALTFLMGQTPTTIRDTKVTRWDSKDTRYTPLQPLEETIERLLPQEEGGVHSMANMLSSTPGLHDISLLSLTGKDSLLLMQTGVQIDKALFPVPCDEAVNSLVEYREGSSTRATPTRMIFMQGGALTAIGPVTTSLVARGGLEGNDGYVFVGGKGGLAVLRNSDGTGWDARIGLGDNFAGLCEGMQWYTVGSYNFVHSLIQDENYLYLATRTQLIRIDLADPTFSGTVVADVTKMQTDIPCRVLYDIIVSDKLALLATNNGVFRSGNGRDIRSVTSSEQSTWTLVDLPDLSASAVRFSLVSATGLKQDAARGIGSNVYVLTGHRSMNFSHVYWLTIAPLESAEVSDDSVALIPTMTKSQCTPLLSLGSYKDCFATDGILYMRTQSKSVKHPLALFTDSFMPLTLDINEASQIVAIERHAALGVWLMAGDFGLRVNG